jgi:hypothetical protein
MWQFCLVENTNIERGGIALDPNQEVYNYTYLKCLELF